MDEKRDRSVTKDGVVARLSRRTVFIGGAIAILFLALFSFSMSATSSTNFCLSCHEMKNYKEELSFSTHVKDEDGKEVGCSQCHLPRGIGPRYISAKSYSGLKDLFVHFVEQPQELNRKELQIVARRFIDDGSCLDCHADLYKNAKGDGPITEIGKVAHEAYEGKDGKSYRNCVSCHVNLAHLPGFDKRLDINQDFVKRLERKEAYK